MVMSKARILQRFLSAQDRLVFQASDLSLGTIAEMVKREAIDVNPSYQRRERWPLHKQSELSSNVRIIPPLKFIADSSLLGLLGKSARAIRKGLGEIAS
jgi:hypothetical protein